jgi:hypothetical protein
VSLHLGSSSPALHPPSSRHFCSAPAASLSFVFCRSASVCSQVRTAFSSENFSSPADTDAVYCVPGCPFGNAPGGITGAVCKARAT